MGPYFSTAYIAKGIEVALIVLLAVDFARHDGSPIAVVRRELAAFSSLVGRRGTVACRRLVLSTKPETRRPCHEAPDPHPRPARAGRHPGRLFRRFGQPGDARGAGRQPVRRRGLRWSPRT